AGNIRQEGRLERSPTTAPPLGRGFWIEWALASALGWVTGLAALTAVGFTVADDLTPVLGQVVANLIGFGLGGLLIGLTSGIAQWFILQGEVSWAGAWIWASTLGLGAGLAVGAVVVPLVALAAVAELDPVLGLALSAALAGLIYGLAQREVIKEHLPASAWWVALTVLS